MLPMCFIQWLIPPLERCPQHVQAEKLEDEQSFSSNAMQPSEANGASKRGVGQTVVPGPWSVYSYHQLSCVLESAVGTTGTSEGISIDAENVFGLMTVPLVALAVNFKLFDGSLTAFNCSSDEGVWFKRIGSPT
jgi:hypothetical protein